MWYHQFIMRCLHQMYFARRIRAITTTTNDGVHYDQRDDLSFNIMHCNRYLFVMFHSFDSWICTLHTTLHTCVQCACTVLCECMKKSLYGLFFCLIQVPLWNNNGKKWGPISNKIWKIQKKARIYFIEYKEDLLAAKRRNQTCVTQFFCGGFCCRWI